MNATRRQFVKTLFAGGQASFIGHLLASNLPAAPTPESNLSFLIFGDWGTHGGVPQMQVAGQMTRTAESLNPAFMIAAGDNFYDAGVQDVHDAHWQASFERVYAARSLQIPCYAILGNHDYCGNCDAQIEYAQSHPRWVMPARFYTHSHTIGETGTVQFFHLDTCPFLRDYHKPPSLATSHDEKTFDARQRILANVSTQDTARQLDWFKQELSTSKADWKIAVGHHPIYSGGTHGDQPELIEQVLPLLRQYGVQVYLCGHDHDLQHLQADGINFFCSGAAGARLYPLHHTDQMRFAQSTFGFMSASLKRDELAVQLIDDHGTIVYQTTVPRPV